MRIAGWNVHIEVRKVPGSQEAVNAIASVLNSNTLPAPDCELGYTQEQLIEILGDRLPEFNKWIVGQTAGICDGRSYDHDKQQYNPTGCGPHGFITYSWDVKRFVDGRPIID